MFNVTRILAGFPGERKKFFFIGKAAKLLGFIVYFSPVTDPTLTRACSADTPPLPAISSQAEFLITVGMRPTKGHPTDSQLSSHSHILFFLNFFFFVANHWFILSQPPVPRSWRSQKVVRDLDSKTRRTDWTENIPPGGSRWHQERLLHTQMEWYNGCLTLIWITFTLLFFFFLEADIIVCPFLVQSCVKMG